MKTSMSTMFCTLCGLVVGLASTQSTFADSSSNPTERELKVLAEVAYLSNASATNYLSMMDFMTDASKAAMQGFSNRMLLDGKQFFMPDFCKLKYVVVGTFDAQGYVAGFYNPFYDVWFMLKVADVGKVSIEGFKVVPGGYFTGMARGEYPPASGAIPAEGYLKGVFLQVKSALTSMRDRFRGGDFRAQFDQMPSADEALLANLSELARFRIGQALEIANDKRVFRDTVISRAIICRGETRRFVADDGSTKLTVKTLTESLKEIRSGFKVVAYFPSGDESNFVFNHPSVPTLLIQANVRKDGKVHLRMFDANSITKDVR